MWKEKVNFGKKYMGVVRTTFLIGADGRVARLRERECERPCRPGRRSTGGRLTRLA